jgi:hypothetical protein
MATTVGKITRKKGMLYFVDANGNVKETSMARGGKKKATAKKKAAPKKKATAKRKTTVKKRTATKRK